MNDGKRLKKLNEQLRAMSEMGKIRRFLCCVKEVVRRLEPESQSECIGICLISVYGEIFIMLVLTIIGSVVGGLTDDFIGMMVVASFAGAVIVYFLTLIFCRVRDFCYDRDGLTFNDFIRQPDFWGVRWGIHQAYLCLNSGVEVECKTWMDAVLITRWCRLRDEIEISSEL